MHYWTIQSQVCNRNQDQRYDKPYFVSDNRTFIIETDRCFIFLSMEGTPPKYAIFLNFPLTNSIRNSLKLTGNVSS